MLYPKNSESRLSDELFRNPTSEYRGTPFWSWNCKLDRAELMRQIDILHEMGFGGFHMHVRSGMDTVYLGDEFMELVDDCVKKAKADRLLAWLYDEDRWPSGFAGGLVTRDEKYRMRYLLMTAMPYEKAGAGAGFTANEQNHASRSGVNSRLIAKFSVKLDKNGCLDSYRLLSDTDTADGTVWYAYIESPKNNPRYNGYTYVNTLDKASIDRFIEVTHEAYRKKIGNEFGKTVPAIFTDEPQTTFKKTLKFAADTDDVTLPFTDDLDAGFRALHGVSLVEHLPELFWELPDGVSKIRYLYHDFVAERFAEAFFDNIGQWCDKNGILLTGHVMREPTLGSQTEAVGEAMRHYRSMGMPGIDMLASRYEYTTAKQAQSAVNQKGCEGMLDELYGVTSWDFDFRGHKQHGDWQAALGVTVRVPHLSWVSMEGESKRDYPASISYQSPWWREYSYIENHFARVNTALTRGKPVVRIGVIHPVESYWLHFGPSEQTSLAREQLDKCFSDVTEWLLFGGLDFDFICESTLPRFCEKGSNPLTVGAMSYDAVVVPACETLRKTTLDRLSAFAAAGGKLIFMGEPPKYLDAEPSDLPAKLCRRATGIPFTRSALLASLEPYRTVELRLASGPLCGNLLYRMRRDGENLWLFVAHGKNPYNCDISQRESVLIKLPGLYSVTLYDTLSGEIKPIEYRHENGCTVIPTNLYQNDTRLLLLTPSGAAFVKSKPAAKPVKTQIRLPDIVGYTLDEPNLLLLDQAEWSVDDEPFNEKEEILRIDTAVRQRFGWTPWGGAAHQPWYLPKAAPEHILHLKYEIISELDYKKPLLGIERPENASVRFNGEKVDCTPVGWYVDKSIKTLALPPLHFGKNTLELDLPYGERTAAEALYLLGSFGVRAVGSRATVTALPYKLGFGSITAQGLPFYSGKLTYHIDINTNGESVSVTVPQYRAALLRVSLDGDSQPLVFSPYSVTFNPAAGTHRLSIAAYVNRTNGFGPLHCCDDKLSYQSPAAWRTKGDSFSMEYRLKPQGILTSPVVQLVK